MNLGYSKQSNHQQRWEADRGVSHAGQFLLQHRKRLRSTMVAVGAVSLLAILAGTSVFMAGPFSGEPDVAAAQVPDRSGETVVASMDAGMPVTETMKAAEPAAPNEADPGAQPRLEAEAAPVHSQHAMRAAGIPAAASEGAHAALIGDSADSDAAEVLLDPEKAETAATFEPLPANDPRWASSSGSGGQGSQQSLDTAKDKSMDADAGVTGSTSRTRTGSIAQEAPVEIAQSEAEVAALEDAMAKENPDAFATAEPEDDAADTAAVPEKEAAEPAAPPKKAADSGAAAVKGMQQAWANADVNMRASGDDEAEVVAVVPSGAEISAAPNCKHWCEVVYKSSRGFIYKTFIRRP